jgi:FKBP-type peptidyl-prolyl cis-trans isomerase
VRVNYTGKLNDSKGKQFDSSFVKKKDEHRHISNSEPCGPSCLMLKFRPLEFKVGTGRVIDGWDEALLTMYTGEKAAASFFRS